MQEVKALSRFTYFYYDITPGNGKFILCAIIRKWDKEYYGTPVDITETRSSKYTDKKKYLFGTSKRNILEFLNVRRKL